MIFIKSIEPILNLFNHFYKTNVLLYFISTFSSWILKNLNWKIIRLIRNLFSFIREIKFRRRVLRVPVFWLLIQRNSGRALWQVQTFKIKVGCSCLEIPSNLKERLQEGSNHFWQVKLFEANESLILILLFYINIVSNSEFVI